MFSLIPRRRLGSNVSLPLPQRASRALRALRHTDGASRDFGSGRRHSCVGQSESYRENWVSVIGESQYSAHAREEQFESLRDPARSIAGCEAMPLWHDLPIHPISVLAYRWGKPIHAAPTAKRGRPVLHLTAVTLGNIIRRRSLGFAEDSSRGCIPWGSRPRLPAGARQRRDDKSNLNSTRKHPRQFKTI